MHVLRSPTSPSCFRRLRVHPNHVSTLFAGSEHVLTWTGTVSSFYFVLFFSLSHPQDCRGSVRTRGRAGTSAGWGSTVHRRHTVFTSRGCHNKQLHFNLHYWFPLGLYEVSTYALSWELTVKEKFIRLRWKCWPFNLWLDMMSQIYLYLLKVCLGQRGKIFLVNYHSIFMCVLQQQQKINVSCHGCSIATIHSPTDLSPSNSISSHGKPILA